MSGAGPAILVIVDGDAEIESASDAILGALRSLPDPRLLTCRFEETGAMMSLGIGTLIPGF